MSVWKPASQEIDPVVEAVNAAARATILPIASINSPPPAEDGVREVRLPDGRILRLRLAARGTAKENRGGRAVVIYGIAGNAVVGRDGYSVTGQAVLDTVTRAFLDVDCQLRSVGAVTV